MAYQPKSYRKFLATATTAAVAAGAVGAVAPATANAQDISFTDVPADAWYAEAVYSLAAEGAIEGVGNGLYAPQESVTRAQIATLYAKYLQLDTENVTAPGFSDIDGDSWYYGAVAAAADAGLFEGYPNGTFQPNAPINRAELAEVITRSFGVEATSTNTPFTDLEGYNWAEDSIAALVEAGIVEGRTATTYVPGADVTRAEAAAFLYKSIQAGYGELVDLADVETVESTNSTTTTVTLTEAFETDLEAKNFDVQVNGDDVEVEVSEVSEDGLTVTLTHDDLTGEEGTITVNGVDADFNYAETVISSVEAPNLGQVVLTFSNSDFDMVQVINPDNYSFEDADGDDLEDQDDEEVEVVDVVVEDNKVWLTLGQWESADSAQTIVKGIDNQTEAKVTVNENVLGDEQVFDVEFSDNEIPEVTDAQVIGEDAVKVWFSEPMETTEVSDWDEVFSIDEDGDEANLRDVKFGTRNDVAVIELSGANFGDGDTVNVDVDNEIEDLAGFNVTPENFELTAEENLDDIEITGFRNASQSGITLVFNKDIKTDNLDPEDFYHTNKNDTATDAEVVNGNEIKLTFDEGNELPEGSATVYVASGTLEDYWGVDQDSTLEFDVQVGEDNTAPEIDKIEYADGKVTIEFTKDLDENTAEDEDNYKILDSDGDVITEDIEDAELESDDSTVVLTLEDELPSGNYDIEITDVEDTFGNVIEKITDDFDVDADGDFETDQILADAVAYEAGTREFEVIVDFGRKMTVGDDRYSIENLENYNLALDYGSDEPIEAGTYTLGALADEDEFDVTVEASDEGYAAKITIEADDQADYEALVDGGLELGFDNFEDDFGNRSNEEDSVTAITVEDDSAKLGSFSVDRVVKTDEDEVEVFFTEGRAVDFVEENEITVGGIDVDDSRILAGGTKVVLTLDDDIADDAQFVATANAFETPFGLTSAAADLAATEGTEAALPVFDTARSDEANASVEQVEDAVSIDLVFTGDVDVNVAELKSEGKLAILDKDDNPVTNYVVVDEVANDNKFSIEITPSFTGAVSNLDGTIEVDFSGKSQNLTNTENDDNDPDNQVGAFSYDLDLSDVAFNDPDVADSADVDTVALTASPTELTVNLDSAVERASFAPEDYTLRVSGREDVQLTDSNFVLDPSDSSIGTVTVDPRLLDGETVNVFRTETQNGFPGAGVEYTTTPVLETTALTPAANGATVVAPITNEDAFPAEDTFSVDVSGTPEFTIAATRNNNPLTIALESASLNADGDVVFVTDQTLVNGDVITLTDSDSNAVDITITN
ncbi:S-layer homology domain-containing protein [Aureibacillus halotolerans]|uniref:S-layer family protein n=1 Tax=Aureibacillus halotolerans TaxID=1508390 RepID=A0A4R6TU79_9BACI|nr:S-layer homology domain-containing protein [Aureibacillus halotolerans]TDQ36132.1 S-layer family protein [Aureibacillus halotolerans]